MATFTVDFLGCKVSQTDIQEIRERLVADGHLEAGDAADVAVVNTCCVTHEAVRKSRQAARRAARTAGRVYVTGCGANLAGEAFAGLPENVTVVRLPGERTPEFVARDVGAIGCVQADVGLDRVRAFVKVQDGCSFSCAFCVIPQVRGASRSRAAEAVLAEVRPPRRAGSPRSGADRHQPRVLSRPRCRLRPRSPRPRGRHHAGLERLRLSSIEVNHLGDGLDRRDARDAGGLASPPCSAPVGRRPRARGDGPPLHERDLSPPRRAGRGLQPDRGRDRRLSGRGRRRFRADARRDRGGRDHESARVPVLAPPRDAHGRGGHGPAGGEARTERAGCARSRPKPAGDGGAGRLAPTTPCSSTARVAATGTTTLPGSWTPQWAGSCAPERWT